MKTVKGICQTYQIDRSTVLKAAQQNRIPARQEGTIWLIDEEHEGFRAWLHSRERKLKAPEVPISQVACFPEVNPTEYVHPHCLMPKYNTRKNGVMPVGLLPPGTRCAVCDEEFDRNPYAN